MKLHNEDFKWYEFASLMVFGNIACICFIALTVYFAHISYLWGWPFAAALLTGVMPKSSKDKEE